MAIVKSIVSASPNGPYGVAKAPGVSGTITFSHAVWQEKWPVKPGTYVFLTKLEKRRSGWRAGFGRLWRLSDEQGRA